MDSKLPSLEDFLRDYGEMLWRSCLAETSHRQDAEDLMQMVLLRLRRSIERAEIEPITSPRALALSMLRFAILDYRRKAIRSRILEQIIAEEMDGPGGVIDLVAQYHAQLNHRLSPKFEAAHELISKLRKGKNVAGLSKREQQAVLGCILREQAQESVAEQLGIARGTVAVSLARAKVKLQAWLEERIRKLEDPDGEWDDDSGDDWFFDHGDGDLPLLPSDPSQSGPEGLALPEDDDSCALSEAEKALYADLAQQENEQQSSASDFLDELLQIWLPFETLALEHCPSLKSAPQQADLILRLVFEHALEDWREEVPTSKDRWIVTALGEARLLLWIREEPSIEPERTHRDLQVQLLTSGSPRNCRIFISYSFDRDREFRRHVEAQLSKLIPRPIFVSSNPIPYRNVNKRLIFSEECLNSMQREGDTHLENLIRLYFASYCIKQARNPHRFRPTARFRISLPERLESTTMEVKRIRTVTSGRWNIIRRSRNRCRLLDPPENEQSLFLPHAGSELIIPETFQAHFDNNTPTESHFEDSSANTEVIVVPTSLTVSPTPQPPTPSLQGHSPSIRVTAHEPGYWFTHPERDHAMNRKQCLELSLKYLQARADRHEIETLEAGVVTCPEIAEWFRFTCRHFYAQEMIDSSWDYQPHAPPSLWPEGLELESTGADHLLPERSKQQWDEDF